MFGEFLPDLPDHGHNGLVELCNAYPSPLGYEPIRTPTAFTAAALGTEWRGGGSFTSSGGEVRLIAGTSDGVYSYAAGAWTSKLGSLTVNGQWFFDQFGDNIIGVYGGAPVNYNASANTAAALAGSPPVSTMVAVVRDHVFLAGDPTDTATVTWSANNNAEGWTIGTDDCDSQQIPDGGPITGLAGGEYGLVFQDTAINMFEYVAGSLVFTRRKISQSIGAICQGGIAPAGRKTFFLSRRGFYMIEEGVITPIGQNKVDDTFFNTYTQSEIVNNMRATVDPERSLAIWSMPGRLWVYNWELQRWSKIDETNLLGVSAGATTSLTLTEVEATYPSLENVDPSLDDPFWNGGDPVLLIAKSDGYLYSFSGADNKAAYLIMAKGEIKRGRNARVRRIHLVGDATSATLTFGTALRLGDSFDQVASSDVRSNGDVPLRCSGRYFQFRLDIPQGTDWTFVQGIEIEASTGGRR